jgi:hypothetical protein
MIVPLVDVFDTLQSLPPGGAFSRVSMSAIIGEKPASVGSRRGSRTGNAPLPSDRGLNLP